MVSRMENLSRLEKSGHKKKWFRRHSCLTQTTAAALATSPATGDPQAKPGFEELV